MEGFGLACAYGGIYRPPTNLGDRRVGPRCLLQQNSKRFFGAPPEYHNLGGEFSAVLAALIAEGSFWLRQALITWRISTHAMERLIERHVTVRVLAEILEHGFAENLTYRPGGWTMDPYGFPVFHGFQSFRIVSERGHVNVALLGEGGQTGAGHIRHVLSISTVVAYPEVDPQDYAPINRRNGIQHLANRVLALHRAEAHMARRTVPISSTMRICTLPPEGTEARDWIDRHNAWQAQLNLVAPPAPKVGALVAPQPPRVPAPPARAAPPMPVLAAPRPAPPPAKAAAPQPVLAAPSPAPPPAKVAAPPPALAAPPPAEAAALWLPADPWLEYRALPLPALVPPRPAARRSGPAPLAVAPVAPAVPAPQGDGIGEWL